MTPRQAEALTWLRSRREQCSDQADATDAGFSRSLFVALERQGLVRQIHIGFINRDKWVAR